MNDAHRPPELEEPESIGGTLLPAKAGAMTGKVSLTLRARGALTAVSTFNAVSSVAPVWQQTAIIEAEPVFAALRESELHVFATDQLPIGPRIKLDGIDEPTLKALANWEQSRRAEAKANKLRAFERVWWILGVVVTAVVTAVITRLFSS